jgi:hypothetical protein
LDGPKNFEIDRWTIDALRDVVRAEIGRDESTLGVA